MYEKHRFAMELAHLSRAWRAELDRRLVNTGLSQARWLVLLHLILNTGESPTQRELADWIGIESPTLARTLDALETMKMVEREPCGVDRRIKRVLLTEEARQIAVDIAELARELRSEVFVGISDDEIDACQHLFQKMFKNLDACKR